MSKFETSIPQDSCFGRLSPKIDEEVWQSSSPVDTDKEACVSRAPSLSPIISLDDWQTSSPSVMLDCLDEDEEAPLLKPAPRKAKKPTIFADSQSSEAFGGPRVDERMLSTRSKQAIADLTRTAMKHWHFIVTNNTVEVFDGKKYNELTPELLGYMFDERFYDNSDLLDGLDLRDYSAIIDRLKISSQLPHSNFVDTPMGMVNFDDGILVLQEKSPYIIPHDPQYHFSYCLEYSAHQSLYHPGQGVYFERFIETASNGDPLVRIQIFELIAAVLTGLQVKGIFFIVGPSGCGKSQILTFLCELVGRENSMSLDELDTLGQRFGGGQCKGRKIITINDAPDKILSAKTTSTMKQSAGVDFLYSESKYKDAINLYEKPIIACASNFPLKAKNLRRDTGLLARLVNIRFVGTPSNEEKIPDLYKYLLEEAPYIIHEAIPYYYRLVKQKNEPTLGETLEDDSAEPIVFSADVQEYVARWIVPIDGAATPTDDFYNHYITVGGAQISKHAFSVALASAMRELFNATPSNSLCHKTKRGYYNYGIAAT